MKTFSSLASRWLLIILVSHIPHSFCSVEDVSNIVRHLTIGEEPNLPETGRYTNEREGWCRIVASSGECSISYGADGDVLIIFPVQFLEDYRTSNFDTKRKLAEILAGNFDKVIDLNDTLKRQLEAIIKNERFKDHLVYLEMLGDAQDEIKIRANTPDDPSRIISKISDVLDPDRPTAKLSPSLVLTCITNTTFMNTFSDHQIGSLDDPLGRYFLSKSLLNGMIERENTSLSIIGARFGFDYIYNGSQSDHQQFPKFAMGIAQASNGLAKVAGPIGTLEDLSAWSFTKSIQRRQRSSSKYNRNDAVIELALDSVSTVSAKPAEEFPPTTPSVTDVGAVIDTQTNSVVSTCQEADDVAIINSVLPAIPPQTAALKWDLSTDWFGTSTKASVDALLAQRSAKDTSVQHNLKFLEDNNDYLGIVFPSQTLTVTDSCTLTVQTCALTGNLCHGSPKTLGTGCGYNQNCGGSPCLTRNVKKDPNSYFHDVYICSCNTVETFTPPGANSQVNFRNKVSLRWDYLLPADIRNGEFQCKPGRTHSFTRASENVTRNEYLCSGAVALLQPTNRRAPGQKMIYDLKDGNDLIYADGSISSTPSIFFLGNQGTKNIYGGEGPNEFILNGDCRSALRGVLYTYGAGGVDTITLGTNCARGYQMNLDLSRSTLFGPGNNTLMNIYNFGQVNGRLGEADKVTASCTTRFLNLNGGNSGSHDIIEIPTLPCTNLNLTINTGSYTAISSKANGGVVTTLFGSRYTATSATYDIHPASSQTHNIIFLNTFARDISQRSISQSISSRYVIVALRNSLNSDNAEFRFNFKSAQPTDHQQTISFVEDYETNSVFVASLSAASYFYHKLPVVSHGTPTRTGNLLLANIFEILNSKWSATGGSLSDEFILRVSTVTLLDGAGGDDTLRLHQDLKSGVTINLSATTPYRNIENIIGHPGNPATVTSGCTTKSIDLKGGSSSAADTVNVPPAICSNRNLQIVATGRTTLSIDSFAKQVHNDKITLILDPSENVATNPNQISITSSTSNPDYFVSARFTHADWTMENLGFTSTAQNAIQMRLTSGEEYIDLHLKNLTTTTSTYCPIPYIQLAQNYSNAHPGQLIIKRESTTSIVPEVLFHLNSTSSGNKYSTTVQGWSQVRNLFKITEGTWSVRGGNKEDIFQLNPSILAVQIDGGTGENILMLEGGPSTLNNVFHVNLQQQQIGYAHVTKGTLKQISHIFGRVHKADVINCDCNTKTVNARGGSGTSLLDDIQISAIDCPQDNKMKMNIAVPSFTKVANTANEGEFSYHVEDLTTTSLSLKGTQNNRHHLDIMLNAWEIIDEVAFDKTTNKLTLETASNSHNFELSRQPNSPQFNNPVFAFHKPGSSVTSDIQVSSDGVTTSAISIQGQGEELVKGIPVDVNRFLVNITETGGAPGTIQGSEKSIANQFWILDLQTPLELLNGAGGTSAENYLHIFENFGNGEDVEVDLSITNGNLKIQRTAVISKLENIHNFHGRTNLDYHDKAYVTCDTKSVTEVEHVVIRNLLAQDHDYNLVIGVGPKTIVDFSEFNNLNEDSDSTGNQFTYKFSSLESFNINYENSTFVTQATHTYLLAVTLDDLTSLEFDTEAQVLNYKSDGVPLSHKMIGGIPAGEQFYRNPVMLTQDGFRIQVDATGGIYLTLGAGSSFRNIDIRSTVIPSLSRAAKNTRATIIIQTDEELVYVGHGEVEGDRNVLQNVGYSESHLVGGGAKDTIFDIVNLTKSVFIYPGFADDASTQLDESKKQTVDLTDIVVPIRQKSGGKYLPQIGRQDDDLCIEMVDHNEFPGKVIIVDGAKAENEGRLQFLLSNSLMDLVGDGDNWKLEPRPVYIPEGGCYTLAKEDFEIGQDIRVEDASNFNPQATFGFARNVTDLLLTTLFSRDAGLKYKMTTVVVLNYFNRIPGVMNVTTTLPGLGVMLDGATIQNKPNSMGAMMTVPEIPSWGSQIKKMEESLLETIGSGP